MYFAANFSWNIIIFIFTKGIFINRTTEKELVKFFGLIAVFAYLFFMCICYLTFYQNTFKIYIFIKSKSYFSQLLLSCHLAKQMLKELKKTINQ